MKGICVLIFLLFAFNCFAQKTIGFDKIIINYYDGHSSWGDPGVYSSGERFVLTPRSASGYKIDEYEKIEKSAGDDGKTYSSDTTVIPIKQGKIIKSKIDSLYAAINQTKNNFTFPFIRSYLKSPTKAQIFTNAKQTGKQYKFEDDDEDDLKRDIMPIKNFVGLDTFLKKIKPNPNEVTVRTDVWEVLQIYFITKSDTTVMNLDFVTPAGQPFSTFKKREWKNMKSYVNLEVNVIIADILPVTSIARKRVEINSLTDDYIRWYVDEVL